MRLAGHHTAVPRHGQQNSPAYGGVIRYKLTDVEKAYARADRQDLIPTAAQRGLEAPPVPPKTRTAPDPAIKHQRKDASHVTKEVMEGAIAAGLTNAQIAKTYNITVPMVSTLLKRYGLAMPKIVRRTKARAHP